MEIDSLRLDKVDALLRQAGVSLAAPADVGSVNYLQSVLDALCELSSTDPLTGAMNRRAFEWVLEQELERVSRCGEYALLLSADIDHFKSINDRFGHPVGDLVLQAVTQRLRKAIRPMDLLGRLGGEEFGLLCPGCPPSYAAAVAERVRLAVAHEPIPVGPDGALAVTISVGGAFALPWIKGQLKDWMSRADELLYRAKREGRNRVFLESMQSPDVSAEEKSMLFGWDANPTAAGPEPADK